MNSSNMLASSTQADKILAYDGISLMMISYIAISDSV